MTRQFITFPCEGHVLHGTLDQAAGKQALLIVSGGNEVRGGAWNGQAQFAARIAAAGHPVLRFDRRGIGDSEGQNGHFRGSVPDIQAAIAALRQHCPQVNHLVGLGNCDAASALMLSRGAGLDALVLSNPWTFDEVETAPQVRAEEPSAETPLESNPQSAPMTPAVLRRHYLNRLTDPKAIWRLLTGKVNVGKLAGSLQEAAGPPPPPPGLFGEMVDGISSFLGPIRFLVADRDRTGLVFASLWQKGDSRLHHCPGASHSFVEPFAQKWLEEQVLAVLRGG